MKKTSRFLIELHRGCNCWQKLESSKHPVHKQYVQVWGSSWSSQILTSPKAPRRHLEGFPLSFQLVKAVIFPHTWWEWCRIVLEWGRSYCPKWRHLQRILYFPCPSSYKRWEPRCCTLESPSCHRTWWFRCRIFWHARFPWSSCSALGRGYRFSSVFAHSL